MNIRVFPLVAALAAAVSAFAIPTDYLPRDEHPQVSGLRVSNNHTFPIRETVAVRLSPELAAEGDRLLAVSHSVVGGTVEAHYLPVQVVEATDGNGAMAWVDVQLRPAESRTYQFQSMGGGAGSEAMPQITSTFPSGLPHRIEAGGRQTELFDLALLEIFDGLDRFPARREEAVRAAWEQAQRLSFDQESFTGGTVLSTMIYRSRPAGENEYQVEVRYQISESGTCDIEITLQAGSTRRERGYLALAKVWPATGGQAVTVRWKGERLEIQPGASSPPRTNRMHSWGRDVNWLALGEGGDLATRSILAAFSPNLTRSHNNRYFPANDYLINEYVFGDADGWVMLSEIARENEMQNYVPHTFVLPTPEEPIEIRIRALPAGRHNLDAVDASFTSFAGYQRRSIEGEDLHISFGVPGVSFGTSYFPHSTFGENFEFWRSAGLEGDRWWPRFGANWRHFQPDIERDMRIANAMGLDWIRIHHFDAPDFRRDFLSTADGAWMAEYLDFMARTARDTGLRLFLDFSVSPADARLVAERWGDVIGFYEMQNEVLLRGAFEDRIDYWRDVRQSIREVQPEAPVFVTGGPQFYSVYERLDQLGLEVDAVGQHAYVDARQSPGFVRDVALSLGGYAARTGRVPLNSEYNWRMITRETELDQARHFFEIYDNFLSQRSVPLLLQFQFIETLAVAPHTRGAQRHYEPLRLDRTPKMQANAFHEIIQRYSRPDHRNKVVQATMSLFRLSPGEEVTVPVMLTNRSNRTLEITRRGIAPEGIELLGEEETITLRPRQSHSADRVLRAPADLAPGFYHLFEEIRFEDTVRYAWSFGSHRAQPRLDLEAGTLEGVRYAPDMEQLNEIDLSSIRHIVFGFEAPALEVDWALYIYNTLRAATGTDIHRWADDQLTEDQRRRSLLLVGNQNSNALIAQWAEALPLDPLELPEGEGAVVVMQHPEEQGRFVVLITGSDDQGVQRAASDFVFRYWRHAKDATTFRSGMAPPEGAQIR